jgi:thioredoxin 2
VVRPVPDGLAGRRAGGREYAGRLKDVKLNIDEAPAIAARYGVQGIPLLIVIKNGQEADRLAGAAPPAQLRAMLERHVTAVAEPPTVSG